MTTIQVQVTPEELVKGVEQLNEAEFEQFIATILTVQAHRKAPVLSGNEVDLLMQINQAIPVDLQQRYEVLIDKRRDEALTPEEYEELLRLTERVEELETQRVQRLAQLAGLRKVSLQRLMSDLGIKTPRYA